MASPWSDTVSFRGVSLYLDGRSSFLAGSARGVLGDGGNPGGWLLGTAQVMHRHPVLDHLQGGSTWDADSLSPSADMPLIDKVELMLVFVNRVAGLGSGRQM
jgi:hypothetical protein